LDGPAAARDARDKPIEEGGRLVTEHVLLLVSERHAQRERLLRDGVEGTRAEGDVSDNQASGCLLHSRRISR
jgi:hypothetical protein